MYALRLLLAQPYKRCHARVPRCGSRALNMNQPGGAFFEEGKRYHVDITAAD